MTVSTTLVNPVPCWFSSSAASASAQGGRIIIMASFRDQQQPAPPSTLHTSPRHPPLPPPNRLLLPLSRRPLYGLGDPTKQAFRIKFDGENHLGNSREPGKPCRSNNNYALPFFPSTFFDRNMLVGPVPLPPSPATFFSRHARGSMRMNFSLNWAAPKRGVGGRTERGRT